jgi:hypothetical protein
MPAKINMVIPNGNILQAQLRALTASSNLAKTTSNAPSALNASIIARIHSVKPGCGSCGRK